MHHFVKLLCLTKLDLASTANLGKAKQRALAIDMTIVVHDLLI